MRNLTGKTLALAVLGAALAALPAPAWGQTSDHAIYWHEPAVFGTSTSFSRNLMLYSSNGELAAGQTLTIGEDFEMAARDGGNPPFKFRLGEGSTLNVVTSGYGINLGNYDETWSEPNSEDWKSPVELSLAAGSIINAAQYLSIKQNGTLRVEDGANVAVNLTDATDGILGIGQYFTADSPLVSVIIDGVDVIQNGDSSETYQAGGNFILGANSVANIAAHYAYFGGGSLVQLGAGSTLNITGTTIARGTLDVGANTLNINGNLYLRPGSIYKLGHDGTNGGLIDVSGITTIDPDVTVNLGGGFESLSDLPGTVILRSGTFSAGSTAPKSKLFTYALSGTELTIASEDFAEGIKEIISAASGGGVTDNYSNVGSLVNRLEHDDRVSRDLHGRLLSNLEKIDALAAKGGASETALKQFVGEEALTAINAQADTLIKVNTALNNRFQAIHNFRQAPSAGYGAAANRFWVNGFGQWNRQKDTNRLKGYDYNLGGLVLGYDRETAAASGLTLGLNGAVTKGTLKNNDGLAETDVRAVNLGLYGTYEFGGGFFIDANLGYGYAENEAEINLLTGGRKTGDFNSHSYQAGLNLGYAFNLGGTTRLTPSAGLQFTHIKQDGWREKIVADPDNDVVANWFDTSKHNFVEIPLNLKLDATFTTESGISVAPELRVGGVIAANNHDSELRLGFVGADDSTTIRGLSPAKSRFTAGAGLKVQLNETVDFFTGYDLEARSGYQGHTASLGLGFSF